MIRQSTDRRPAMLVVRADATLGSGTGHVMRCLALAQAWQDAAGSVSLVGSIDSAALQDRLIREGIEVRSPAGSAGSSDDAVHTAELATELGATWVVIDGYHFGAAYRDLVRREGPPVLVIDDNGDLGPYRADAILNQNHHADAAMYPGSGALLMLGTAYTLLRREFRVLQVVAGPTPPLARRILIAMGGVDAANDSGRVLEALRSLDDADLHCEVLVGAANPHHEHLAASVRRLDFHVELLSDPPDLAQRMSRAELAVSAGGTTLWELSYLGIPTIAMTVADNQRRAVRHLSDVGGLVDGTRALGGSGRELADLVDRVRSDATMRRSLSETSRKLLDGAGAGRVVDQLSKRKDDDDRAP